MRLVNDAEIADFKKVMTDAHETFARKLLVWYRSNNSVSRWGEDTPPLDAGITLLVMNNYDVFRTWPITFTSESGELDRESTQVFINKEYLRGAGYLNAAGYFDYNPDLDRFKMDGLTWKAMGDTPASQLGSDDIWITLILKREETSTGDKR